MKKKTNTPQTISLVKEEQKEVNKKTKILKDKIKSGDIKIKTKLRSNKNQKPRGLIYLGHIPHGFYEKEMKEYFSQFGAVTNVRVCRSGRTGKSKGYGFVEFLHPDVAKIAAETMNNYIMFKKRLVSEYIPPEKRPRGVFSKTNNTESDYVLLRRKKKFIANTNKDIDDKTHLKKSRKVLKKLDKTKEMLKKYGIEFNLQPVNVPENLEIKKEKENVDNEEEFYEFINDSVDSEVQFKLTPTRKSKLKLSKEPKVVEKVMVKKIKEVKQEKPTIEEKKKLIGKKKQQTKKKVMVSTGKGMKTRSSTAKRVR